jgi:diaminopimelate epimerase
VKPLHFSKMSGAGNDFIAIDNRDGRLDGVLTAGFIRRICTRGLSVGADGLLELRSDYGAAFRMVYYNCDGEPAAMCGNGGRCIVRFACDAGIVPSRGPLTFASDRGLHRAEIGESGEIRIWLQLPEAVFLEHLLELPSGPRTGSLVDTGVPHLVVFVDSLDGPAFEEAAPLLRRHQALGPAGANVDFVRLLEDRLEMRTWERGVEGETLACGTGAVAAAFVASSLGRTGLPANVMTRGGLELTVGMDDAGWWLGGEARTVFRGEILDP